MKIFIPLADGEELRPEVLKGILNNNCSVCPVTSELKEHRLININNNWHRAFAVSKEAIFIGMDSDVILKEGIIQKLIDNLEGYDIVTAPTKKRHLARAVIPHSVFCTRKKLNYPAITETCPVCEVVKTLNVKVLWDDLQAEFREY